MPLETRRVEELKHTKSVEPQNPPVGVRILFCRKHLSQTHSRDLLHTSVDFLHHENPPTWVGVKPATLGTEGQRQTNHATQPARWYRRVQVRIVIAQVPPSREETGRPNYLRRLVSAYMVPH
ncbi:hypothetical protein TNCV_231201 [Trichonephila clavipes]|nr:hypothetical protein TNCV_231201 [Trichonephila clavipes]